MLSDLEIFLVESKKKHENGGSGHGHVHEEGLGVESFVKLHNLHGLVEDGIDEHVAGSVPVL